MVIDSACTLSYGDGNVIVRKDTEYTVPISQIKSLLISSNRVMVSSVLLNELSNCNIHTVFCDGKHNPAFEVSPFSNNSGSAGKIMDQCEWGAQAKAMTWQKIVVSKIRNQKKLLESLEIIPPECLQRYEAEVLPGDEGNCEAAAARVYFRHNRLEPHAPNAC